MSGCSTCSSLLDQPVHDARYPQLAHPATRLGDAHSAHRIGPVAAVEQPSSNVGPRALEIFARVLHRASVDAGASLVGFDVLPRRRHVLSAQRLPEQVTGPPVRLRMSRQRSFIARGFGRGFTTPRHRAPRLAGLLMPCLAERHVS
jgi:hypothetical protein